MKTRVLYGVTAGLLAAVLMSPVMAQGRRQGSGAGFGGRWARAGAPPVASQNNPQLGWGRGGWWARVTPSTPEQAAFLKQVSDIHNKIRALNWEIAGLKASNAPAAEVAKREKDVADLRAELVKLTTANEKLIREMGIPAPYGVCTGTGPVGRGWAGGRGPGARGGFGPRNGTGPNPYCPLKK